MPNFENPTQEELNNSEKGKPMSKEDMDKLIVDAKGGEETEESLREQEMEMMQEAQKQIEQEEAELKTEVNLPKFSDKMKKAIMVAFAGATLFFASGNFEKAEAKSSHNYSDVLKGAAEGIIKDTGRTIGREVGNYPRKLEREEREQERQKKLEERQMQREQDEIRREMEQRRKDFDRQRDQALKEYQRDISRSKTQSEMDIAREKYKLKIQTIDEAENASYSQ